jgi:hypothetical protein
MFQCRAIQPSTWSGEAEMVARAGVSCRQMLRCSEAFPYIVGHAGVDEQPTGERALVVDDGVGEDRAGKHARERQEVGPRVRVLLEGLLELGCLSHEPAHTGERADG